MALNHIYRINNRTAWEFTHKNKKYRVHTFNDSDEVQIERMKGGIISENRNKELFNEFRKEMNNYDRTSSC